MGTAKEGRGGGRLFSWASGVVVFALIASGILSLRQGGRSDLEALLRRTHGERIGERLTPAQASYQVEARQGGKVVMLSLAEMRDRLVFLNFWGTFCPPCVEELPSLLAMARARAADGVVVLAVSYDDSWSAIDDFFRKSAPDSIPSNFIVVRDPGRVAGRDMKAIFGTEKLPESYLIRDGTVEVRYVSSRDWTSPDIGGLLAYLLGG